LEGIELFLYFDQSRCSLKLKQVLAFTLAQLLAAHSDKEALSEFCNSCNACWNDASLQSVRWRILIRVYEMENIDTYIKDAVKIN